VIKPSDWHLGLIEYVQATNARETDSEYLRRVGVKPHVLEFCGDASTSAVLDVGSADGWLLRQLHCRAGYSCDVTLTSGTLAEESFVVASAVALPYREQAFDLVAASLMLMWLPSLPPAFREFRRVTRLGGRLVVAIVHPSYYRTGRVERSGDFTIEQPLGRSWSIADLRIGGRAGPFTYYAHRYADYFTDALAAGWQLLRLREWFIDMMDYNANVDVGKQIVARTDKVPLYVFFEFGAI